jgi:uncharacterized protein
MDERAFDRLRQQLLQEFTLGERSIHGPTHWARVEQIGLRLSEKTGADRLVVRLFSLFHDCRRESDGEDGDHGLRGAEQARRLRGTLFELDDEPLELLCLACAGHTRGRTSTDPTIGTCWDADRLDLPRVSIIPEPCLLSTSAAREREVMAWAMDLSWKKGGHP